MSLFRHRFQNRFILIAAGTDPINGAGLSVDCRTVWHMGCKPLSLVTAVTAQNPTDFAGFHALNKEEILSQWRSVAAIRPIAACKIGMLGSEEAVAALEEILAALPGIPVVFDPLFQSGSGGSLFRGDFHRAFERIGRLATVVTPNLPEARVLLNREEGPAEALPGELSEKLGGRAVILKGGHDRGSQAIDIIRSGGRTVQLKAERGNFPWNHGTGCVFSSALAVALAGGKDVFQAAVAAKKMTLKALKNSFPVAGGGGNVYA